MDQLLTIILYFITGAFTGAVGGLLGIGGASILVPALTLAFGLPMYMAIAVSLLNNVAVSISATIRYHRKGLLNSRLILVMCVGSVAGIVIGTFIATRTPENALKILFGLFLLVIVAVAFLGKNRAEDDGAFEFSREKDAGLAVLGFIMGLVGALLGLAGGTVAVPTLNTAFRMPLKRAIANSLATIILSSSLGALIYFFLGSGTLFSGDAALLAAVTVVPGSIVGASLGALHSEHIGTRYIKFIFYALLLYIAYTMISSGLGR
jgi:uncharacterized protein